MNILSHYRNKAAGLSDLLNFAALVDDGIVLCKSGALLGGFFFRGDDVASLTDERRNDISKRVNRAMARLGNGVATWVDAVRMPTTNYSAPEDSYFADPYTQLIDDDRRRRFEQDDTHYESEQVLVVQYVPPLKSESRFKQFLTGSKPKNAKSEVELSDGDRHLLHFKEMLRDLEDALSSVLQLQRMRSFTVTDQLGKMHQRDQLVNYLNFAVTGKAIHLNLPPIGMYLDAVIGGQNLENTQPMRVGNNYVSAIAIEGYPSESWPGILHGLNNMPFSYRATFRFIHMDQQSALGVLRKYQRKWKQAERGFLDQLLNNQKGAINQDAVAMRYEMDEAITDAQSGLVSYGYATPVIIMTDTDPAVLQENCQRVAQYIDDVGFNTRIETYNTLEAWLGSIPGHIEPNVRRPITHTLSWANMLPLATVWAGENYAPCPFYDDNAPPLFQGLTDGATPFRGNLHVNDLGHTLIVGPTGAGKSVLLGFIAASFRRYRGATITAFDKGGSMMALCLAAGGKQYDLTPGEQKSPKLCPLQNIEEPAEYAWAQEWVAQLYELSAGKPPSPSQRADINNALRLMQSDPRSRSLSHFCATAQDPDVQAAINHYTMTGPLGDMLDAEADTLTNSPFSVFEIEELMNAGDKNMLPVLLVLFHRFEKNLTGQPALLFLDEAWLMLGHPVFRAKIREWAKVLRKRNCALVIATQSLSDLANSGIMDVLQESCPTKIFLPNEEAMKAGTDKALGPKDLYHQFGLNNRQIEIIAEGRKKREYYFTSPLGCRLISLALTKLELAFIGVSDHAQQKRVKALHETYGADWPIYWLSELGIEHLPLRPTANEEREYEDAA